MVVATLNGVYFNNISFFKSAICLYLLRLHVLHDSMVSLKSVHQKALACNWSSPVTAYLSRDRLVIIDVLLFTVLCFMVWYQSTRLMYAHLSFYYVYKI